MPLKLYSYPEMVVRPDEDPDTSYLDQEGYEDRRKAYRCGSFGFIGVFAACEVEIGGTIQTIASPGLWGIEDDSGDDYLENVYQEELDTLRTILSELGVRETVDGDSYA